MRSGTYDITSPRYDNIHFEILDNINYVEKIDNNYCLNEDILRKALDDIGFYIEPNLFIDYIKKSIENREFFKFEFTKTLSLAIECLAKVGDLLDIEREYMAYLEISEILATEYYNDNHELKEFFETIIHQRINQHKDNSLIVLPDVIIDKKDINIIKIGESRPNFITLKQVMGEVVFIEKYDNTDIRGKIVLMTKADPGYDWIFTKGISGLITKYGGVASHMAIRCAEFGIPAAIGCGEKIFNYVNTLNKIKLDCKNEKISNWR